MAEAQAAPLDTQTTQPVKRVGNSGPRSPQRSPVKTDAMPTITHRSEEQIQPPPGTLGENPPQWPGGPDDQGGKSPKKGLIRGMLDGLDNWMDRKRNEWGLPPLQVDEAHTDTDKKPDPAKVDPAKTIVKATSLADIANAPHAATDTDGPTPPQNEGNHATSIAPQTAQTEGSSTPPPPPLSNEPREESSVSLTEGEDVVLARVKDYQRIRQQERGFWGKMGHALADDLLQYVGETRLNRFIDEYRAEHGKDPILTTALVKHVLDNKGNYQKSKAAIASAQATGKAHEQMIKIAGLAGGVDIYDLAEDDSRLVKAKKVIKEILAKDKKGKLTEAQVAELANQNNLDNDIISELAKGIASVSALGETAGIEFQSTEAFMNRVSDELLYAGLSPSQYKQAKKIATLAHVSAFASGLRLGIVLAAPHLGLGLVGSALLSGGASGVARAPKLFTQEAVYSANKDRVANSAQAKGSTAGEKWLSNRWLIRQMAVDWSQDRKTYPWQIFRAVAFGMGLGAISHSASHLGEVQHGVGDALNNLTHNVDTSHVAHAATPDIALPNPSQLHSVAVEGHQFQVPDGVQYDTHNHDLFMLNNGQRIDIAHLQDGKIQDLNGFHVAETQGAEIQQNLTDYVHAHGGQAISPDHQGIYADQRQFEAYVKANEDGSADLTLPPGDNAIVLPNGDMLHFNPSDVQTVDGVTTIHLAPNDPMYHVLINPSEMHKFYEAYPNGGTMLDGVHNGATVTYTTGNWNGTDYIQHSTVNGSAPLPHEVATQQTVLQITRPGGFPAHEEPGEVFATTQGRDVHDALEQVADAGGRVTDFIFQHPILVGGTAASVVAGFMMGRSHRNNPENKADMLFGGTGLGLTGAAAAGIPYFVPGYPIGLAAGYLLGRIGSKGKGKADGKKDGKAGEAGGKERGGLFFSDLPDGGGDETGSPDVNPPGVGPRPKSDGGTPDALRSALQTSAQIVAPIAPVAPTTGGTPPVPPAPVAPPPVTPGEGRLSPTEALNSVLETHPKGEDMSPEDRETSKRRADRLIASIQLSTNDAARQTWEVITSQQPDREVVKERLDAMLSDSAIISSPLVEELRQAREALNTKDGPLDHSESRNIVNAMPSMTLWHKARIAAGVLQDNRLSTEDIDKISQAAEHDPEVRAVIAGIAAQRESKMQGQADLESVVRAMVAEARRINGEVPLSPDQLVALENGLFGIRLRAQDLDPEEYSQYEELIANENNRQPAEEQDTAKLKIPEPERKDKSEQPESPATPSGDGFSHTLRFTPDLGGREANELMTEENGMQVVARVREAAGAVGQPDFEDKVIEGYNAFIPVLSAAVEDGLPLTEINERLHAMAVLPDDLNLDQTRLSAFDPHRVFAEEVVKVRDQLLQENARRAWQEQQSKRNITGEQVLKNLDEARANMPVTSKADDRDARIAASKPAQDILDFIDGPVNDAVNDWLRKEFPTISGLDIPIFKKVDLMRAAQAGNADSANRFNSLLVEIKQRLAKAEGEEGRLTARLSPGETEPALPTVEELMATMQSDVLQRQFALPVEEGLSQETEDEAIEKARLTPDQQTELQQQIMTILGDKAKLTEGKRMLDSADVQTQPLPVVESRVNTLLQGLMPEEVNQLRAIEGGKYMHDPDMLEYVLIPYLPNRLMSAVELGGLLPMRTSSEEENSNNFLDGVEHYLESKNVQDEILRDVDTEVFSLLDHFVRSQDTITQKAYIVRLKRLLDLVLERDGTARGINAVALWTLTPNKDLHKDYIVEYIAETYKQVLDEQDLVSIESTRGNILRLERRELEGSGSDQDRKQIIELILGEENPQKS